MAYLVEILLRITDPGPNRENLRRVRDELTAKFGGVTVHLDSPAEGLWNDDGDVERDRMVIVDVMTDHLDRSFWSTYREELEARFGQDELAVRASESTVFERYWIALEDACAQSFGTIDCLANFVWDKIKDYQMSDDKKAQQAIEETGKNRVEGQELPAAGPHAAKHLTDESKTPGTGALPDREDESVSPGGG